ncbi:MAG: DUF362 domain-containing protein [Candidatus Latescibacterota bacterium]
MARSSVAVLRTSPETVIDDYRRLLLLASCREALNPDRDIAVHITLAWHPFLPSASSPPWQIDGVLGAILGEGYPKERMFAWYDDAAGASFSKGQVLNRHVTVLDRYGIPSKHLDEKEHRVYIRPKTPLRALEGLFSGEVPIPERLMGRNFIHLSTMKTNINTTIHGAVRSIFEGLLGRESRKARGCLHAAMVDALAVSRQIGAGLFTVMDATFSGEGPHSRDLTPHETNLILASADPVALDAVALRFMGFEPMETPFIRIAHEAGLGVGDPAEIETIGEDLSGQSLGFQIIEPGGTRKVRALEQAAQGTAFEPLSGFVSTAYHDWYRYLKYEEKRIGEALRGPWGKVFENYRRTSSRH